MYLWNIGKYRRENPEKTRTTHLKSKYGLTLVNMMKCLKIKMDM